MFTTLMHVSHNYLAADKFWTSAIGGPIQALMRAAALIIVILAAIKATKDILGGHLGKAIGLILGAGVAVVFLWQPTLIEAIINMFAGLFGNAVDSVGTITAR